ncbi:MAG TPA: protein kinase, partial [Thermoanaerobaculia bacterium]|nr:protein kinase [Thermoanaerobaculia bacterium]
MTLSAGLRLGPYEITSKLGEGGMGEVYRATDSKLRREVAIKVLPEALANDAERLARFEREAQLLAQLQHPNIASIFGMEESGSTRALVMELVDGPTLADRLQQGPLSLEESLSIARQIAEALEEAHEKGIVHRDLKPQNVKASDEGKVKVLDFGLAKAMDPVVSSSGAPVSASPTLMNSPTLTAAGTQLGVILGTAAYMAPEQAKGAAVDKRADIWAFGVVLWEMLTGARMFAADSVPETLAGVLKTEIDFGTLPAGTPAEIRRLLRRCLERKPKNRLHDIADARIVLDEVLSGAPEPAMPAAPAPAPSRRAVAWALVAGLGIGGLLGGLAMSMRGGEDAAVQSVSPAHAFRLSEPGNIEAGMLALSPDGRRLVYVASGEDGVERLWVRALESFEPQPLPGSEGARFPFFSPDGTEVAFQAHGELRRVAIDGGAARTLIRTGDTMLGGAWGADGTILLGNRRGVLLKVPAAGGSDPVPAVERGEFEGASTVHAWPAFLPDGRRFVYLADGSGGADAKSHRFLLGSLDGEPVRQLLVDLRSGLAVDARGFLLYARNDQLIAQRLDFDRGEIVGEPVLVADSVIPGWDYHELSLAVSGSGALAYRTGSANQRIDWLDASGRVVGTVADGEPFRNPRLSPDGRFLAAETQHTTGDRTVWALDLERGVRTLLSEHGRLSDSSAWSHDSRWVYFDTEESDGWHIVRQPREGSPEPEDVLGKPLGDAIVHDLSPDGRWLLFSDPGETGWDLYLFPLERPGAE